MIAMCFIVDGVAAFRSENLMNASCAPSFKTLPSRLDYLHAPIQAESMRISLEGVGHES